MAPKISHITPTERFHREIHRMDQRLTRQCDVTGNSAVFDHDLPTERITGRFDESTRAVEEFVERHCLRFARSFLDASPRSLQRDLQERDLLYRNRKTGQ